MQHHARHRMPAVAAAATFALLPTAALADAPASPSKITFTVGMNEDVDSLNPFVGVQSNFYELMGVTYDQLMDYSARDGTPTPRLAESWSSSPDGLTWTYKIRKGVKWSDGVPLTAADAAYTFNRIIHGETEQVNFASYTSLMTEASAPDPQTLVIKVSKPGSIMNRLIVPILPEHIWKDIDEKSTATFKNEENVVGSGPFILVKRAVGQYVEFRANKNYWGGAPKVDSLVFRVFNNADAEVQALKNGEIDFANNLSSTLFDTLKGVAGITPIHADAGSFNDIGFNTGAATVDGKPIGDGHPALKDPAVRRAVSRAIDRKALVDKVIGGYGRPGSTAIPPTWANYHYEPAQDELQAFDVARANADLDAAGYKRGPDGVRRMPDGTRPLKLRFFARQEQAESQQVGQYVQGWLKQLGIEVDLKVMAEAKLTEVIGNGEFDMFEWGWGVEPDPDFQLSTFTCGQRSTGKPGEYSAGLSDSFYCNKDYDALYQQQKSELSDVRRAAEVKQMQKLLYDDAAYVVTYYYDTLQAYHSDRFTGLVAMPQPGGPLLFQPSAQWSYRTVAPVTAAAKPASASGSGGALLWGAGAVVVVAAGGFLLIRRRRTGTADERE
ncbi:ABC transporter substrate-binding protein [Microbispora sp. ATCC PTA-5024]|uniref:ABC transporter substrate-binding protein n=1 Tax=Microbispora sp. ATCC PTA-5024 TaxID=316330 RepID=UPI0003DCAF7E|nr:ABC transporter substrate-binding protein [Microbispora sp. ATCC PTA-5024]ETK35279.1 peptide ABC transporter substrate-binding protein [Microbispora sp. ATCC PTA-5024]